MGYYPASCDTDVPAHACDPCGTTEHGRIQSAAFVAKDFEFSDYTNASEWIAGINSGKIKIIPETQGEFPKSSPVLGQGYGQQKEKLTGFDYTAMIIDPNFVSNYEFYNSLIGSRNYRLAFVTETQVFVTNEPVTIIPSSVVNNDLTSEVTWTVDFKWTSKQLVPFYNKPDGVFDECFIPA